MQEQPDLDLGATRVVQELLSMRLKPSSHGNCPSGPVLVCDEPLGCSSSVLRTGHHFVALRQDRDAQVRNRQRSQNQPLDREKTQKNVDLHFAVESQIHSSSVAPQE